MVCTGEKMILFKALCSTGVLFLLLVLGCSKDGNTTYPLVFSYSGNAVIPTKVCHGGDLGSDVEYGYTMSVGSQTYLIVTWMYNHPTLMRTPDASLIADPCQSAIGEFGTTECQIEGEQWVHVVIYPRVSPYADVLIAPASNSIGSVPNASALQNGKFFADVELDFSRFNANYDYPDFNLTVSDGTIYKVRNCINNNL